MTVSVKPVASFDQLSLEQAANVLYNNVIPACEAKGVKLSSYGNHAAQGSINSVEKYNERKAAHTLFNVARVQTAFGALDEMIQGRSQYKSGSYGLKHRVEEHQKDYITNGDLIAAMLVKGFQARFAKQGESLDVNCEFKAIYKKV